MSWQTIVKENNLDISIIKLSNLAPSEIIGSEYYQQDFIRRQKQIESKNTVRLGDFVVSPITKGETPIWQGYDYIEAGVPFVRSQNLSSSGVSGELVYVSPEYNEKKKRSVIKMGDSLIAIVGATIGKIGFYDLSESANCNQAVAIIRTDEELWYYTNIFLQSKYFIFQLEREKSGNARDNIDLDQVRDFVIPVPSKEFSRAISLVVKKVHLRKRQSESLYIEAEQILLKEINLEGYKPSDENISVRNFSEALADNRFDAEYWQPDYDIILDILSKYKKGVSTIGEKFKPLKGNFKAEKDKEYSYVEIGDVNVSNGEVEHKTIIGAELPANAKIKFGKRQLITSKVRPNRGATAILENHEGYIGSGAFTVLTEKDGINLETLMIYLKSLPIRELLLRYNTGTSYPVITDKDVLKLPIPLIDKAVQKKISEFVSVSAKERQEAKILLEKVKRAVEIFIEKDEEKALEYLEN